jgi:hypothetical protein
MGYVTASRPALVAPVPPASTTSEVNLERKFAATLEYEAGGSTMLSQRWRDRQHIWVGGVINPAHYEVAAITETEARDFVLAHHYSASYPAAMRRFGLYKRGVLAGVAVYSMPTNHATFAGLPGPPGTHVELGRLVLLDEVPQNGESWFIGRTFELLRRDPDRRFVGVLAFSDPVPRQTTSGRLILPGHVGWIYQATNAVYVGRGHARALQLLPDGRTFSRRAAQKIRSGEKGWRYACQLLVDHGADSPPDDGQDRRTWLAHWAHTLCRRTPHAGNHKYLWCLERKLRGELPAGHPYPKQVDS